MTPKVHIVVVYREIIPRMFFKKKFILMGRYLQETQENISFGGKGARFLKLGVRAIELVLHHNVLSKGFVLWYHDWMLKAMYQ